MRILVLAIALGAVGCKAVLGNPQDCPEGTVPNDLLQSCVPPPPCDGGVINDRNECEFSQDAGSARPLDAGGGTRSFPQRQSDAGASDSGAETPGRTAGSGGTATAGGGAGAAGVSAGGAGPGSDMTAMQTCGNGRREGNELCDGADCTTECKPSDNMCIVAKPEGSATTCDASCTMTEITACKTGDGCCPRGCDHASDSDCSERCGDGELSDKELCEPGSPMYPCPTVASCDDNDPCTADSVTGDPMQCSAECAHTNITRAAVSCDDDDPCTDDEMVESSTECSYTCTHSTPRTPTGSCVDTDPCTEDTPVKSTTRCAYDCSHNRQQPTAANCNDGNPCTDDTPMLSTTQCAYDCPHVLEPAGTECGSGRICTDSGKCEIPPPRCGDGTVTAPEECDPAASGWSANTCNADCKRTVYAFSDSDSDCSAGNRHVVLGNYCSPICEPTSQNCPQIPGVEVRCLSPRPDVQGTGRCFLGCQTVVDCPEGFTQCDNMVTLGGTDSWCRRALPGE